MSKSTLSHRQRFTIQGANQYLRTTGVGKAPEKKTRREQSDNAI